VFFEPVDTDDHWFVSQVGYVEGKTFAVFSNLDNEGDGMSDLSMIVGASIGVANDLRRFEWELAEVILPNQFGVNITSSCSRVEEGCYVETLLVVRGDAYNWDLWEFRRTQEVDGRHVGGTFSLGSKGGV
jgi:hypothetical protein